jgi:hypothetical protein
MAVEAERVETSTAARERTGELDAVFGNELAFRTW